jgi:DNA-binding NarL/FixJ family response regulator
VTRPKQRALLVDDHALVRSGIRHMIEEVTDQVIVVGETNGGRDALRLMDELDIDILITDLAMPDLDGIGLIKAALKRQPDLYCIVLSMHTSSEYVAASLKAGARGYLHKNATTEELTQALDAARSNAHYLHPSVAGSVVASLRDSSGPVTPMDLLSDRQREVLKLIADGHKTRQIAETLNLSVKTIETYRSQLMDRLEIYDVPGLVKFAIRHGLADVEPN